MHIRRVPPTLTSNSVYFRCVRLIYVDDSGNTALHLYAMVLVHDVDWSQALASWLDVRGVLRDEYAIPVRHELHAVDFLNGRGNPSVDPGWNRRKKARVEAGHRLAACIGALPVSTLVYYSDQHSKRLVYRRATEDLQAMLTRCDDHAIVVVDGDGTDAGYDLAHRGIELANRRILEDPWHQASHANQWIMIADLVAYLAFQSLNGSNSAFKSWYSSYFAHLDLNGGPVRIR